MSIFYCHYHNRIEDSDYTGYTLVDDVEVCSEGKEEFEDILEEETKNTEEKS